MKQPKRKMHIQAHARKRAAERFGIRLNKWDMKELGTMIRTTHFTTDTVRIIGKQTLTRSRFDLLYKGVWIPVVYDNKRHGIVTVLPERVLGHIA